MLLLNILTVKFDSPSEKPVMYQGFRLPNKLFNGVVDREEHDLIFSLPPPPQACGGGKETEAVIKWLERILI